MGNETDSLIEIANRDPRNSGLIENLKGEIEPVYKLVGRRIKEVRDFLGWTQEELAERMQTSRPTIANIEGGRQRIMLHDIENFCRVFNMTYQKFMRGIWFIDGRKP